VEESTNCTTPPVDDKADKSSTEDPRAQALVAQLGSKVPNDAPIDDDLGLLNFTMMVSWCHIPKFSFRNVNHFSHKKLKISKRFHLF
jgi:hypothetical protein